MIARLVLISLLALIAFTPCRASAANDSNVAEYNLQMNIRGREMTCICVMEKHSDGDIVGTVVTEFGVKIFDFTCEKGKTKVLNVLGPLNKWYIRKVIKGDIAFILNNMNQGGEISKRKRHLTIKPNGVIIMNNDRFKICYTFTPMESKE